MPTSRRRVVTQRKNSPPVAHWSRRVAASSLITVSSPPPHLQHEGAENAAEAEHVVAEDGASKRRLPADVVGARPEANSIPYGADACERHGHADENQGRPRHPRRHAAT